MTDRQDKLTELMEKNYNAKFVRFDDHIEILYYGHLRTRLVGAAGDKSIKQNRQQTSIDAQTRDQQLSEQAFKIKRKINYYLKANSFDLFWTLTFDDQKVNAKDYIYSRKRLQAWLKYQREKYGKFAYLFVPELHPESGRIHFHGVTGGLAPPLTEARYPKSGRLIVKNGVQIFNADNWQNGFSTVSTIQDKNKTANYIAKYITKELMEIPTAYHQPRYFVGRGLKQPKISFGNIKGDDLKMFKPKFVAGHIDVNTNRLETDVAMYQIEITKDGELRQEIPPETIWKLNKV